jgi:hypothetical protein
MQPTGLVLTLCFIPQFPSYYTEHITDKHLDPRLREGKQTEKEKEFDRFEYLFGAVQIMAIGRKRDSVQV